MFSLFRRNRRYFEGVDITDLEYLGYSMLWFHGPKGPEEVTGRAAIHFFCDKDDHNKRLVVFPEHDSRYQNDHVWVMHVVPLWTLCEIDLEAPIMTYPSKYLREFVLKSKNKVWSVDDKKWVDVKNNVATVEEPEDNVIKISFGPKKDVDKS